MAGTKTNKEAPMSLSCADFISLHILLRSGVVGSHLNKTSLLLEFEESQRIKTKNKKDSFKDGVVFSLRMAHIASYI